MVKWSYADPKMAEQSERVLQMLLHHGYEAYWVGGCVRDELIGRPVHDMDLTTSALPEQMVELFEHTVPTGISHGTITVLLHGYAFEVTTFRIDGTYENHRRPEEVTFVKSVVEDLRRRDFTMNAIARDTRGRYLDPFAGQQDVERGIIRCVGDPEERFEEDALRMVRCIRFASVFDYRVMHNTWKGLLNKRDKLSFVAMERIRVELEKVIAGAHPLKGLELLGRSKLLTYAKAAVDCSRFNRMLVRHMDRIPSVEVHLRWTLLLYSGHFSVAEAEQCLRNWTFTKQDKEQICDILKLDEEIKELINILEANDIGNPDLMKKQRVQWMSLVLKFGIVTAKRWIELHTLISQDEGHEVNEWMKLCSRWNTEMNAFHLKELDITGREVMALSGRAAGPWLGQMLNHLLLQVAVGVISNHKESLIREVERVDNNHG
ncbi:tRNA nucleotidyltransferase (CCA-adding enzyme) [Paenibacillus sp. DS2015]|uniref:CCA tRNA nucleotidyltransferase n=1 Tax=Paenibacillus sp. DS2015 TaxID=3373917 RepID=UPI003D1C0BBB